MPAIASLHDIERTGLYTPGFVNHPLDCRRRQCRPVLLSEHIRGRDMAPSCVCLRAGVDPEALVGELRGPLVCFGGGEIVVEDLFGVLWVDVYGSVLGIEETRF